MPKSSRILFNPRFFARNTLYLFCNLAEILINLLAKNGLKTPQSDFFSCKEYPNKISAQNFNFEQKRLQRHLGPYILKSFEHVGMFKTYQKVKKQVWFYPAMLLIVSCPLLQTVNWAKNTYKKFVATIASVILGNRQVFVSGSVCEKTSVKLSIFSV